MINGPAFLLHICVRIPVNAVHTSRCWCLKSYYVCMSKQSLSISTLVSFILVYNPGNKMGLQTTNHRLVTVAVLVQFNVPEKSTHKYSKQRLFVSLTCLDLEQ